jgi:hypothetical protein
MPMVDSKPFAGVVQAQPAGGPTETSPVNLSKGRRFFATDSRPDRGSKREPRIATLHTRTAAVPSWRKANDRTQSGPDIALPKMLAPYPTFTR